MFVRLNAGYLQAGMGGEGEETPNEKTIVEAYEVEGLGGHLERIERDLRRGFNELWRSLPHVMVVIVTRADLETPPFSITAALLGDQAVGNLAAPVTNFNRQRAEDAEASETDILLKLIRLSVISWRRKYPHEWREDECFDTIALTDVICSEDAPRGLIGELQAHGILHLDVEANWGGHWDDSLDLCDEIERVHAASIK